MFYFPLCVFLNDQLGVLLKIDDFALAVRKRNETSGNEFSLCPGGI
jgi:hypothetical protein